MPPLRTDLVQRPQIIERLNKGLRGKLTMISAPAGSGKTTTLIEWLNLIGKPSAWLSLDAEDNDISRFLTYFISALQTVDESFGESALSMRLVPQAPSNKAILSELINSIGIYQGDLILVLDDYHAIESQQVHDLVNYFLENQPENIHLVIASRYDPPLPISRLRGQRQLMEIRSHDLRFDREEMDKFLNEIMGLELNPENIELLEERTEGWIVSLQLLALSLQDREDKQDFVTSFSGDHHYVVDYLVDEIMTSQSEEIQTFLYQTSILDRLCAPLSNAVVKSDKSHNLLQHLEKTNLFLIPLDTERQWYRYHHLFVDYLRQHLQEHQPEIITGLHQRAAEWYKNNGFVEEAIKHSLRAEEYDFAATIIEKNADDFWWSGDQATLQRWLTAIPDETIKARPRLSISFAITDLMAGRSEEIEKRLQAAEKAIKQNISKTIETELHGIIAAIRASSAFLIQGNIPATIKYSQKALELLPEENATWRSVVALDSGDAHSVTGDLEAAKQAFHQAVTASKQAKHVFLFMLSSAKLANNYLVRGHLHAGAEAVQQALEYAEERGVLQTTSTALLFTILADILCEWNQLTDSLNHIERGIELSERSNNLLSVAWSYRTLTKILFSSGDLVGAQKAIRRLESLARKTDLPSYIISSLVTWKVRIEIAKSRIDKSRLGIAERLLQEYEIKIDDEISYDNFLRYFSLARLRIAQKKYDEAEKTLDWLLITAESWGYANGLIELLVLKSLVLFSQDKETQALTVLGDALAKAEPEGYVRIFVDEGEPMAKLLQRARANGIAPDYVNSLLAAFDTIMVAEPSSIGQVLLEPLSKRELEVLRLLTTELSVPEIADELIVSANTVRTHTRNIYAKLDVNNRRSAVRRAEELKLL
jgi:LuxR family maltose regulon positive regulatory protein